MSLVKDKRFLENLLSLLLYRVFNYALPFLLIPYLIRTLGIDGYGKIAFSQGIIQYAIVLVDYGFNMISARDIAQAKGNRKKIRSTFWQVQYTKLSLFLLSVVALILLVNTVGKLSDYKYEILVQIIFLLGYILTPVWYYQGLEKMKVITTLDTVAKCSIFPITLWLVNNEGDGLVYLMILSLVYFATGFLSFCIAIRKVGFERYSVNAVKEGLVKAWPMFLSSLSVSLYNTTTTVLLGLLTSDRIVGIYSAADKIIRAIVTGITPVHSAFFPRVSQGFMENREKAAAVIKGLLKWQTVIMLAVLLAVVILAKPIMLFLTGEQQGQAHLYLIALSPLVVIVSTSMVAGNMVLIPSGNDTFYSKVLGLAALLHIIYTPAAIYFLSINGAVASSLMTELLVTVLMYVYIHRKKILST